MAEADFYQPIKQRLEELFAAKKKSCYLEVTAAKGLGEKLKSKIPPQREIVFAFLKKRPDLFGFVQGQYAADLITVEVKERIEKLDDIYQAKLYKDVFDARYGFLITAEPIPEAIKRLCRTTVNILRSASDSTYCFLAVGQFDQENGQFVDWFEKDPFSGGVLLDLRSVVYFLHPQMEKEFSLNTFINSERVYNTCRLSTPKHKFIP